MPKFVAAWNARFGEFCVVHEGVQIGDDTEIRNFVEIRQGTKIGKNCYIDSRVSFSGKGTTVGDNVTIRYAAILCEGLTIEDDVFISPQVMFNSVQATGERVTGTTVKQGAFIGTGCIIEAGVTIGKNAVIMPGSYVNKDVPDDARMRGIPAVRYYRNKTKEYYESFKK